MLMDLLCKIMRLLAFPPNSPLSQLSKHLTVWNMECRTQWELEADGSDVQQKVIITCLSSDSGRKPHVCPVCLVTQLATMPP